MTEQYIWMSTDYTVQDNKPVVYVFARNQNGERRVFKIDTFKPYFYVPADQARGSERAVLVDGTPVVKLEAKLPRDVAEQRKFYTRTGEADILFPIRYLIDKGVRAAFEIKQGSITPIDDVEHIKMKELWLDTEIELVEKNGKYPNPDPMTAPNLMMKLSLCVRDRMRKQEDHYSLTAVNEGEEKELLLQFLQIVETERPDVFLGYNVFFDLAHIIGRMKFHHIQYHRLSPMGFVEIRGKQKFGLGVGEILKILGVNVFDIHAAFLKLFQGKAFESTSLGYLVKSPTYGWGEETPKIVNSRWNRYHIAEVTAKCDGDVRRLMRLSDMWKIMDHYDSIRRVAGCKLDDALTTTKYFDVLILRAYHGKFILPTKAKKVKVRRYQGATVLQPGKGVFSNVIGVDFSTMYPNTVIAYNMSPETLTGTDDGNVHNVNGILFKKQPKGIVAQVFEDLITLRTKVRNELKKTPKGDPREKSLDVRQYALKQIIAAMYGQFGFVGSRLYEPRISASITFIGRQNIGRAISLVEGLGYKVMYGDTDSLYLQAKPDEDPIEQGKRLEKYINDSFVVMAKRLELIKAPNVEFDVVFKKLIFSGKKKRYAGLATWEKGRVSNEVIVKGFEMKKSDAAGLSKASQKMIIGLVTSESEKGGSEGEIRKYVKEIVDVVPDSSIDEVGIPKALRRDLRDYKTAGAIVPILFANQVLGKDFNEGSRAFIFWIKHVMPGMPGVITYNGKVYHVKAVALENDDDLDKWRPYINWDVQTYKILERKLEPILDAYGLSMSEIMSNTKQMSLEVFA